MYGKLTCAGRKAIVLLAAALSFVFSFAQNAIVTENALTGNPSSEWDINGAGDLTIQGFATDISVNNGQTVHFKINVTDAAAFNIKIYRIGYYQGNGARLITNLGSFSGTIQPAPITDPATGLVDCGNWSESAQWNVPSTAVSGVYIARLTRNDNSGASHIIFIVRNDASHSDILFQTSDATWQAYNGYGGNSLYVGSTSFPGGHAAKVSYNRPFTTRSGGGGSSASEDWFFNAEYPMIRWMERNGYDITYFTDVDAARNGGLITQHKAFLSVGHDEYWSAEQRNNIIAARNAGVHLAFFCGNEIYWKTRWDNSIDGSATSYRTLVCYKEGTMGENACGSKCDPLPNVWTGLWRDGCSFPSADGCQPENALSGNISWYGANSAIEVPDTYKNLRFWRNTSVTGLGSGQTATLSANTLGYEFDWEQFNAYYPAGRIKLSSTTIDGHSHKLSLYRHSNGAFVFSAGTVQWAWGLDGVHDRGSSVEDARMQQATVNLFADMTIQPGSLQTGLVTATASTDNTAPSSTITFPANAATTPSTVPIVISGTATDVGGVVAGVEISLDGGTTWQAANGTGNWNFSWTPSTQGPVTIKCRAFDDSGNMQGIATTITITVTLPPPPPTDGPGGPILVISDPSNAFSRYAVEMLRAEGLNEFAAMDISSVTSAVLNNYDVAVLGNIALTAAQVTMLTNWVNAGGSLVAFKPDAQLSSLMGITPAGSSISNKYILVNTASGPGAGIINQTIQFHGTADLYTLNGATSLATLYSNATTATSNPAVTTKNVGPNGGVAVAFTYDLARSIIYTRQGNPAWQGQSRDGQAGPIRSDNLFFGNAAADPQPDWVDFNKIDIPQADEQQRLLANIIIQSNLHRKPLPRFWYLPRSLKAAVVMTGDDHATGGTIGRFDQYIASSSSNTAQAITDWVAIRSTSYIYPNTNGITDALVASYQAQGFEIGLHVNTGCSDWTASSLLNDINTQSAELFGNYPSTSPFLTNRTHCIAWSDWSTQPEIESSLGIRLDVNYYYWPASWILDRPGMFTGSGMPMRFAKLDGSLIDCYQVPTQMTDESGQDISLHINSLLDKALGTQGYYGVFCANMHTDNVSSPGSDAIITSALARHVPVISSKQMLEWLDGRNNSSFSNMNWSGNQLAFTINAASGANNLRAMLPVHAGGTLVLTSITRNGAAITDSIATIKGIQYAFFNATSGSYIATYLSCTPPAATIVGAPSSLCPGSPVSLQLSAATGQAPYSLVVNGTPYNNINVGQTFATFNPGEVSVWGNTGSPANVDVSDNRPIELGVKFRASVNGYITGIRFYKGTSNTGTHVGTLWTSSGTQLATATFSSETASGWQEVRFASPVAVTANTTYIASYFSPTGFFSITSGFFTGSGLTNGPVTALQNGADGSNAIFNYDTHSFPASPGNGSNYWVDVLFTEVSPSAASLNYTLTNIVDANGCDNTGSNLSTATITINPQPNGTITNSYVSCSGQPVNLTFNSTAGTGPFTITVDGHTYNNVISGQSFNSGVVASGPAAFSLWDNTATPAGSFNDGQPIEVGVKFRSSTSGQITSIRFYKAAVDGNPFTCKLYSSSGVLLGSGVFSNTNAIGWQTVNLASPVNIAANTTYIASYFSPGGNYTATNSYFNTARVNGPLTGLQDGTDGPNAVYQYGGGFPTNSFQASNYWVDVIFATPGITTFHLITITDANGCTRTGPLQTLNVNSGVCAPLPVTLINFTATPQNRNVLLKWTTTAEINNRGFELQRSVDGSNWTAVSFINGAGNSSTNRNYSYTDLNLPLNHYYYRLKQVDYDNHFKYSVILSVFLGVKPEFALGQNSPNPFNNTTTIQYTLPAAEHVSLTVYDLHGRIIKTLVNEQKQAGTHAVSFDASLLSAGVYYYKIQAGEFSDVKKMVVR